MSRERPITVSCISCTIECDLCGKVTDDVAAFKLNALKDAWFSDGYGRGSNVMSGKG